MSRSYRHSCDNDHHNGGRNKNRRGTRREQRLVREIAAQADAFVGSAADFGRAAGFALFGREQTIPAKVAMRRN